MKKMILFILCIPNFLIIVLLIIMVDILRVLSTILMYITAKLIGSTVKPFLDFKLIKQ